MTLLSADLETPAAPRKSRATRTATGSPTTARLVRAAVAQGGGQEVEVRGAQMLARLRAHTGCRRRSGRDPAGGSRRLAGGRRARWRARFSAAGEPIIAEGGYLGLDVHRVQKLCDAGHGGQTCLFQTVESLFRDGDLPGELIDLGAVELLGLPRPEKVFRAVCSPACVGLPEAPGPGGAANAGEASRLRPRRPARRAGRGHGTPARGHRRPAREPRLRDRRPGQRSGPVSAEVPSYKPDVAIVDVRMPPTHTDEGLRAAQETVRGSRRRRSRPLPVRRAGVTPSSWCRVATGCGQLLKDRVDDVAEPSPRSGAVSRITARLRPAGGLPSSSAPEPRGPLDLLRPAASCSS